MPILRKRDRIMTSRYDTSFVGINDSPKYEKLFKARGIKQIDQYFTPHMQHITTEEMASLNVIPHVWTVGDRFYKLAHDYYNDPKMWWLIAWFNRTPTEADVKLGYIINIPLPVERVLSLLGL